MSNNTKKAPPVSKTWGNIKYENLLDIIENRKNMITEWTDKNGNTHKQIAVKGAQWANGNITIQAWDKEKKETINLIYLKPDIQIEKEEDDFPF